MKKIVILHGIRGLRQESIIHWLISECEKLGLNIDIPNLATIHDDISYKNWVDGMKDVKLGADTILFGRSLGAQFAVKYLAEIGKSVGAYISCPGAHNLRELRDTPTNKKIKRIFSVGPEQFSISDNEFKKFRNLNFPKVSLYSNNDNYYEQANLEAYANAIGAKHVFIPNKGHFNEYANVTQLPEALNEIRELLNES